jgi:hypothetical protein
MPYRLAAFVAYSAPAVPVIAGFGFVWWIVMSNLARDNGSFSRNP